MGNRKSFVAAAIVFFSSNAVAEWKPFESDGQKIRVEVLTQRNDVVWGFDFLGDGKIVFTERKGAVNVFDPQSKSVTPLKGAPSVWAEGQGGMLDVRVHPKRKDQIYLTYSEPVGDGATTSLAIATLSGDTLKGFKKIFSAKAPNSNDIHFGSRIEFDGNGHLFVTVGDRNARDQVQNLGYHIGSTIRLNEDGSTPKDNPFFGKKNALPEIWSYGHRSPQGLARQPESGELWLAEMGPRGGDELNLIRKGANYGWPEVTQGREYSGAPLGVKSKAGMEEPVVYWDPSISPSGLAFYSGDAFPKWKGDAFLANLSSTHLRRLVIEKNKVVRQEKMLEGARLRSVRTGPDGFLYVSSDDGRILRLMPAKKI